MGDHKWSPISYKSSAGQRKHIGQRPMLYHWTTQPTYWMGNVVICSNCSSHLQCTTPATDELMHTKQGNIRLHFARAVHSRHPLPTNRQCGLSSTCWRRTEPRTWATCTKNFVKITHVVLEISCRTDRQTDRQRDILTDRYTDTHSSQYFTTTPVGKVTIITTTTVLRPLYRTTCLAQPAKKWRILLEQSFTARIRLLMATSAFGLGRIC